MKLFHYNASSFASSSIFTCFFILIFTFILVFIGLKMILPWAAGLGQADGRLGGWVPAVLVHEGKVHVPTSLSLSIIGFILALAVALSVAFPKKK